MARDWDVTRKSIGTLSIWIGTAALFAPRALPRLLGADDTGTRTDVLLPLLVRLAAARNIAMGAAFLLRRTVAKGAGALTGFAAARSLLQGTARAEGSGTAPAGWGLLVRGEAGTGTP